MKQPECICGCGPRSHYEYHDDGSGCTNCSTCDHFELPRADYDYTPLDAADDDHADDEHESPTYRSLED